jgi:hypothetical protein
VWLVKERMTKLTLCGAAASAAAMEEMETERTRNITPPTPHLPTHRFVSQQSYVHIGTEHRKMHASRGEADHPGQGWLSLWASWLYVSIGGALSKVFSDWPRLTNASSSMRNWVGMFARIIDLDQSQPHLGPDLSSKWMTARWLRRLRRRFSRS